MTIYDSVGTLRATTWNLHEHYPQIAYSLTVGGNNIFDEQPEPAEFGICCGGIVRLGSVQDWQGLFYYIRGNFRWD